MTLMDFIDCCAEMGLDISGTAASNNFCAASVTEREKRCAAVKEWVDHAAVLGAPVMRIFSGNAPAEVAVTQARQWVVECIEKCCAYAATRGVNLDTGNFRTQNPDGVLEKGASYADQGEQALH